MRTLFIWLAAAFVFGSLFFVEAQKEALLNEGQTAYLALAPAYFRPKPEGDFLALNYEIANQLAHASYDAIRANYLNSGLAVIRLDSQNVATLVDYYHGALSTDEHLLRFHLEGWRVIVGAKSCCVPDGSGQDFKHAAYGEFKISPDGTPFMVALCDTEHHRLTATATH